MVTMTATKMLTYANRRLVPGEDFETKSNRDLKVLLASRKAKIKRPEAELDAPPVTVKKKIEAAIEVKPKVETTGDPDDVKPKIETTVEDNTEQLAIARADYRRVFDRPAHHTWNVATIREKIAAAGT